MQIEHPTGPAEQTPSHRGILPTGNPPVSAYITELYRQSVAPGKAGNDRLKKLRDTASERVEALERRLDLFIAASEEDFVKTLWWMSENGLEEELDLLRQIRKNPPYSSQRVEYLLDIAEQRSFERINEPRYVMSKGLQAYRLNKTEWERVYHNQVIALNRGRVVAHAPTREELMKQVARVQKTEGSFRPYIVEVGSPDLEARGPLARPGLQAL
jgi:hypothetical protein